MRLKFDDYGLDIVRRELCRASDLVAIEPQVFDLLAYLVQNPDRLISRDELLQAIWDGRFVSDSAIDNRINAARRAIGDSGEAQRLIRTVPRKGFRFIGAVEACAPAPSRTKPVQATERRRDAPSALAGGALAVLSATLAGLLLWPGSSGSWKVVAGLLAGPRPMAPSEKMIGMMPRLTIAVLPLTAPGNGIDQPKLADGITEGLTTELSRYRYLTVTSKETAAAYAQRGVEAKQIGRELGVRYIVDGSIEQTGGQVRVTTRVADTGSGSYLWADRYDRPSGDLLSVEDEIVGRMLNEVKTALTFNEASRPDGGGDTDAVQLTWKARALHDMAVSRKGYAEAAEAYERVLALAPRSLTATVGLAGALASSARGLFGGISAANAETLRHAEGLIDGAVTILPRNAGAHFQRGQVLRMQGRCDEAIRELEMAIDLDRNLVDAYSVLGQCKLVTGAFAEVIPLEEKALRLAPSSPFVGNRYQRIGMAELLQSHVDGAISWLEKARAAQTIWHSEWVAQANSGLAAAYALNGDTGRAADALAEARKSDEYPSSIAGLCRQSPICSNPTMRALVEPTYLKGLRLAGLPDE